MTQRTWQLWLPADQHNVWSLPQHWEHTAFGNLDRTTLDRTSPSMREQLWASLHSLMEKKESCALLPSPPVKAVFMDVDATVIQEESLDVFADCAGKMNEVAAITHQGMTGAISFATSLRRRLEILQGTPEAFLTTTQKKLTLAPGMQEFAVAAHHAGIALYLVSGGFTVFVEPIAQQLNAAGFHANQLGIKDGKLTGAWEGTLVDAIGKAQFVQNTCALHGWQRHDIAVIGDGFNDRHMMETSEFAIGFQPKNQLIPYLHAANYTGSHRWLIALLCGAETLQ